MKRIAILAFDQMDELDAVGPWEILATWTCRWPDDGWETVSVGTGGRMAVRCAKGLVITPQVAIEEAGPIDVLVHPGGSGTTALMHNARHLDQLRDRAPVAEITAGVCTGSLVLAAAGLLRNRPATTHWASLEMLAEIDPTIEVRPDDRFVDDGDVVTSAGVSAGIDMALHLVARLAGVDRAREVRRMIQYDPAPPV